jgi:cyclase
MRRERVSDDIYVFTSDLYAQVTATAVVTQDGIVVIDTLPYPQETRQMIGFLNRLGRGKIRYVINTHWHGDHTNGNYLFEDAQLVAHQLCAEALAGIGTEVLQESKDASPDLQEVEMRIPDVTFDEGEMYVHLGEKSLRMFLTPGHTHDSTSVYIKDDKVLVAADAVMPVPFFGWGNREDFIDSLRTILELNLDSVVQGHGEVLLRGEIPESINSSIRYLELIQQRVNRLVEGGRSREALRKLDIESCGKSRIPLNGLVEELHSVNVQHLYDRAVGNQKR